MNTYWTLTCRNRPPQYDIPEQDLLIIMLDTANGCLDEDRALLEEPLGGWPTERGALDHLYPPGRPHKTWAHAVYHHYGRHPGRVLNHEWTVDDVIDHTRWSENEQALVWKPVPTRAIYARPTRPVRLPDWAR